MLGTFGAGLSSFSEGVAVVAVDSSFAQPLLVAAGLGVALNSSAYGMVGLLFPNGRLVSARWRWAAGLMIVSGLLTVAGAWLISPFVDDAAAFIQNNWSFVYANSVSFVASVAFGVAVASFTMALLVAGTATVWRLRHAQGAEREQLKWVVYAVALSVAFGVVLIALTAGQGPSSVETRLLYISFSSLVIAAGFGIAIFRYHLYDIDRVVRLSVVYGLVVAVLGGVYAGGIVVLSAVLPGQGSLAVAGTTLAVAALFNPLRRRIQAGVEKRFHRRGYDPTVVADALSVRIRREVESDQIMLHLAETVDRVLAPRVVGFWIRQRD
ncbi:MAG: hypothetical protein PVF87_10155 [Acidimicrobiia bacterium]